MVALDTNLLIYAHRNDVQFHKPAAEKLRALAEGPAPWAIPWPCVHEFLAVVTNPRVFQNPTSIDAAISQVKAWMESPALVLIAETQQYWPHVRGILESSLVRGPRVHDARIAALCLLHGVSELWSADRDFSRFPDLRVVNPLIR